MLHVLGTIRHSNFSSSMQQQQSDLVNWVKEIHSGMYSRLVRTLSVPTSQVTDDGCS